ncbi:hypothetical protein L7F22_031310 [Adiantum nelumboides]|nr:hypothetical protein [Adiantum nelumboides]
MEVVHANADIMAEFCHFKRTSKQMSKEDVKRAKQQLQQQGPEDDSSMTEEIEDDDNHIGIYKASQTLEDAECDSDSNSNFNSDSVSILDLNSNANLDAKTNSDANFHGSRGKLDEEKAKDIAINDEVIFGNADGAEFYHGDCQAICQFGSQAVDVDVEVEDVQQNANLMSKYVQHAKWILEKTFFGIEDFCQNLQRSYLMMYDVPGIQHNQRSVVQDLDHGKVKKRIQEDFQELAREVAKDQEFHSKAFKGVILMTNIQFNFGDVLVVESSADFIGLWSTLGQNGSDILCLKSIQLVVWQEHVLYYYAVCLQDQFVSKMFWKIRLDSKRNSQISNANSYSKSDADAYAYSDTELNAVKSRVVEREWNIAGEIWNVWQMQNERLVAKMEEMKNKSKGTEVSAWGLSKWKPKLSSGILEPDRNLTAGAESDMEKQVDSDFVAEKAVEIDAEGVAGEQTT